MRKIFFLFILSSGLLCQIHAQSHLYMNALGKPFQLRIYEEEYIKFRFEGDKNFTSGIIESFTDSGFYIHETHVLLSDIERFDIRGKNFGIWSFRSSPGKLMIAGLFFPLIDIINHNSPPAPNTLLISGILFTSGIVMKSIQRKYFIPGPRNKVSIILDESPR